MPLKGFCIYAFALLIRLNRLRVAHPFFFISFGLVKFGSFGCNTVVWRVWWTGNRWMNLEDGYSARHQWKSNTQILAVLIPPCGYLIHSFCLLSEGGTKIRSPHIKRGQKGCWTKTKIGWITWLGGEECCLGQIRQKMVWKGLCVLITDTLP